MLSIDWSDIHIFILMRILPYVCNLIIIWYDVMIYIPVLGSFVDKFILYTVFSK